VTPTNRKLYLINADVTSGLSANLTHYPVVGFSDTGPVQDAPMVMQDGGSQVAVVSQSTLVLNGAAPVPIDAFYDAEREVYLINGAEYLKSNVVQFLRTL